ncbi:hypothetical protein [Aurantibacillus circumpalustris]|uniref:hypothetical protein n=1 Tax=Aurantibacillus circumpalustris TaxID=3036359 RepID=UPI00295A7EC9|nr:hypothetical protein [Aurantibacillus circumpalustris]
MKKIVIYISFFPLIFSFCRKQENLPEPEITDPHFFVKCVMDGQALDLEAGNEEYYMNSSWYHQDSDYVFVYKANLAKQIGVGYQITILFNDNKYSDPNDKMSPDSALIIGTHLYNDQNLSDATQMIKFEPVKSEVSNSSYSWLINDGSTITTYGVPGIEDRYSISEILNVGKTYSVTFNYDDPSGVCSAPPLTNVFKMGSSLQATVNSVRDINTPDLKYTLSYSLLDSNKNLECTWTLPDATNETTPTFSRIFTPGVHLINLKLRDKNSGEVCSTVYQLDASGNNCTANYNAVFSPIHNKRLYASITILLTDPNGIVYSSKNLVQPNESNFEITSVIDYKVNEKNEKTKSIGVRFNCVVKNGNNEISLKNGTAKVAVAYK